MTRGASEPGCERPPAAGSPEGSRAGGWRRGWADDVGLNTMTIAGDFLSLLESHRTPAVALAGSGRLEVPVAATTVFAFRYSGGVVIAGDQRATAGHLIVTDRVDKIIELDGGSVMAIAGVPAVAFEMARVLRITFEYYRRSQLQAMSLQAKLRALSRLLRENLPLTLQGVGAVAPLFAGVDPLEPASGPQIFFYDPLGAQFLATHFAASGSGSGSVRSVLTYLERFGAPAPVLLEEDDAVRLALRLLVVAAEHDSATAGVDPRAGQFATVRLLRTAGIEAVEPERQRRLLGL